MDAGKRSDKDEDTLDSEIDATDDGASSGADGSVLRKRVTFDATSEEQSDAEVDRKRRDSGSASSSSSMGTVLVLITLAFVVFSSLGFYYNTSSHAGDVDPEWITEQLTKNVRIVRSRFPSQPSTIWADVYSGVQRVLMEKPTEPSVFLLTHEGDGATAACLARKVGGFVHALLGPTAPDFLVLDGANAGMLSPDVYRLLVERHRVVIVDSLQLSSTRSATGLRPFCDVDSPLVDRAVYIFTLRVANDEKVPRRSAEKELAALWAGLDKATLGPLVECVAGGHVFRVVAEKNMADGC